MNIAEQCDYPTLALSPTGMWYNRDVGYIQFPGWDALHIPPHTLRGVYMLNRILRDGILRKAEKIARLSPYGGVVLSPPHERSGRLPDDTTLTLLYY